MKVFLLSLVLLTSNLFALEWYDLEVNSNYQLAQNINFENEKITLKKNNQFKLYDIITLPINVSVFQFEVEQCPGQNLSTEMIIIDPTAGAKDASVGVQLQEGCLLEVFVELKDYFTKSLFQDLK